ncbi:hypothetical protein DFR59_102113 [Falsibacillus pallidus]|uniref:Uncharacterized protein n=1 Tax=Falsibacillus pallidus TaxID=493781 RepID=A0A370GP25_9BACI|nr:hypothetical protein DFR59_102113 [Falsibacillus pallidus]
MRRRHLFGVFLMNSSRIYGIFSQGNSVSDIIGIVIDSFDKVIGIYKESIDIKQLYKYRKLRYI